MSNKKFIATDQINDPSNIESEIRESVLRARQHNIASTNRKEYSLYVYVDGGYFFYRLETEEQALQQAEQIMSTRTYRRNVNDGVEIHNAVKVKVVGPNINPREIFDNFVKTS